MKKFLFLAFLMMLLFGCKHSADSGLSYPIKISAAINEDINLDNFSKKSQADFDWKSIEIINRREINWLKIEFAQDKVGKQHLITPSSRSTYRVIINNKVYHPFSGDFEKLYSRSYRSHPYIFPLEENERVFYIYFEKSFMHFDFNVDNVVIGTESEIRERALKLNKKNLIVEQISIYLAVTLLIIGVMGILLFFLIHKKQSFLLYFGLMLIVAGIFHFRMSALSVYMKDAFMGKSGFIFSAVLAMNLFYLAFVNTFFQFKRKALNITIFSLTVLAVVSALIFDQKFHIGRMLFSIFNLTIIFQIIFSLKRNSEMNNLTKYILALGFSIHTLLLTFDWLLGLIRIRIHLSPFVIGFNAIALAMVFYLITNYRNQLVELEQSKVKLIALQKENLTAELVSLKQQIDPHFLFNSLNTLIALIEDSKDLAQDFVQELSKVYRFILKIKNKDLIQVKEEIRFVESYLFLLSHRFKKNLVVEFNLDQEINYSLVVPASIQMLIENCVKHNVVSSDKPLKIKIFNDADYIIVENNYQPKLDEIDSHGIGLDNLRKRFSYFTEVELKIITSEDSFRIMIPIIKEID